MKAAPIDLLSEPATCEECAASCPFKVQGCPLDLATAAVELRKRLRDLNIPLDGLPGAINQLSNAADACRKDIIVKVQRENQETETAARIMAKMLPLLPLNGNVAVAKLKAAAATERPAPHPRPAPVHHESAEEPVEDLEPEVEAPARKSRGDPATYVNPSDQDLEEEYLSMEGVVGMCTHPKIRVTSAQAAIEAIAPEFERSPFKGMIGAIVRRHKPGSDIGRITVYYRGPAQGEATKILKERKKSAIAPSAAPVAPEIAA